MNKQTKLASKCLLGAASLIASSASASAAVLLVGFNGTGGFNHTESITGFGATSNESGGSPTQGSTTGLYGNSGMTVNTGAAVNGIYTYNNDATRNFTFTNNTGSSYVIDSFVFDATLNAAQLHTIAVSGDIGASAASVSVLSGAFKGYGSAITGDNILADGESFTLTITNTATGTNKWDNIALVGTVAVPEPSSTALLGLGGLALIFRRRKS